MAFVRSVSVEQRLGHVEEIFVGCVGEIARGEFKGKPPDPVLCPKGLPDAVEDFAVQPTSGVRRCG